MISHLPCFLQGFFFFSPTLSHTKFTGVNSPPGTAVLRRCRRLGVNNTLNSNRGPFRDVVKFHHCLSHAEQPLLLISQTSSNLQVLAQRRPLARYRYQGSLIKEKKKTKKKNRNRRARTQATVTELRHNGCEDLGETAGEHKRMRDEEGPRADRDLLRTGRCRFTEPPPPGTSFVTTGRCRLLPTGGKVSIVSFWLKVLSSKTKVLQKPSVSPPSKVPHTAFELVAQCAGAFLFFAILE